MKRPQLDDRGSVLPLILGFFVLALLVVGAAVSVGQAFTQQRDLQDACDGAASAAAAGDGDIDRGGSLAAGSSLQFTDVRHTVAAYFDRDPSRHGIEVQIDLSDDRRRITLHCRQTAPLAFGRVVGRPRLVHTAVSSARAAVVG